MLVGLRQRGVKEGEHNQDAEPVECIVGVLELLEAFTLEGESS